MSENLEYRVSQLESERLSHRVAQVEFIAGQLQGEVSAIKEITRNIGTKLDIGIQELKAENIRNQAFIRGIIWVAGGMVGIIGLGPSILELIKLSLGAK